MAGIITLNEDQRQVVASDARAIVVVAGAGAGKTEVVARRIERILKESESEEFRVLAVTYTVKAADELRRRLSDHLGDHHERVDADTIHGFAWSLLRKYGTRIGLPLEPEIITRDEDRIDLLASWLGSEGIAQPDNPVAVLADIDLARSTGGTAPLADEWRSALSAIGAFDYPGMLERAIELAEDSWVQRHLRRVYKHVFVDEAQNLARLQFDFLCKVIGGPGSHGVSAVLVGDPRQSIVGFAGADSKLFEDFSSDYNAQRVELKWNYRSAKRILRVERAVAKALGNPPSRPNDEDVPAEGSVIVNTCESEADEGSFVANWISELLANGLDFKAVAPGEVPTLVPEQIAVLSRAATHLRPVRQALEDKGIVYASASSEKDWVSSPAAQLAIEVIAYKSAPDHTSTRRRITKLLGLPSSHWWSDLKWLASSANGDQAAVLHAAAQHQAPGSLMESLDSIVSEDPDWENDLRQLQEAWMSFVDRRDLIDRTFGSFRQHIARCQRGDSLGQGVRLLTVHRAQGREFKAVAVVGNNDGQFPDFRARRDEEILSELRTFYVAISRPTRALLLTRSEERLTRAGRSWRTEPSEFLRIAEAVL